MFEQELYKQQMSEVRSQEGDLFHDYEIKSWRLSPRIYKILAASAIFNITVLLVFGQANLLTMRGCDSPFVGRVCQVLDTVYVSAILFGTERDVIDAAYEKTELGDAEITYIDVSGETPPLSYPEGYFQIANPEQYAMLQQQAATTSAFNAPPGFTPDSSVANDFLNTTPVTPKANPNALQGDEPTSPFSVAGDDETAVKSKKGKRGDGAEAAKTPEVGDPDAKIADAGKNPDGSPIVTNTDPITGDEINNRPLTDLGKFVSEKVDKNEVDLQSEFVLNAKGKLTKEGKLDPKTFRYIKAESTDKDLIEIVQEAIEAFSDSGRLKVLEKLSGKDLNLTVQQDALNISAVVQSELESENRARSLQSSLGILLAAAKRYKSAADASANDKDDLVLLEGAKIESDGKNLIIRFVVPKAIIHQMIQRKLAEQKLENKKPSGTAVIVPNDNTAKK